MVILAKKYYLPQIQTLSGRPDPSATGNGEAYRVEPYQFKREKALFLLHD